MNKILEKKIIQTKKSDFLVSSDFEAYEKVMNTKKKYDAWLTNTYTIEKSYSEMLKYMSLKKS